MSIQKSGKEYMQSYSGLLKFAEEVMNVILLIFAIICGYSLRTSLLHFMIIYAFTMTIFFFVIHYKDIPTKSELPWHWIQCTHALIVVIVYCLASSVTLMALTKIHIITGVIGYMVTVLYILETLDNYHTALTPRAKYVWSTPNVSPL